MTDAFAIGRRALTVGVVLTTIAWSMMAAVLVAPLKAHAAGCVSGTLIKGSMPAVYYCGADGKRYVFTNDKNYFTWYPSFANITIISDSDLGQIAIGGNVTYRPGVKMIKIQSDPRTYAVAHGGVIRHVSSEALAACLWGVNWNQHIDDISDAFYINYTLGFPITSCLDYNRQGEMDNSETVNEDKELTPPVPPPQPSPPSVTSTSPVSGATGVALDANVMASFSEAMDASTINASTFTLARGSVSVGGTVTYSNGTATFNPNVLLDANTTYTATITSGARDLGGTSMSGNHVWSFTTGASVSGAPTVTSTNPPNGAVNVGINSAVSATFSESMNASTLHTGTFTLMRGSESVSGTVTYSGNTATFYPNGNLVASATYTATITTGARDLDGNPLASPYAWTFTSDGLAAGTPTVVSTSPSNGATGVAVGADVTATFSEAMNASTINGSTFTLMQGSTSVSGTVTYSSNTATFNPNGNLTASATYTATITAGARDTDGNSLATSHTWTFMTAP